MKQDNIVYTLLIIWMVLLVAGILTLARFAWWGGPIILLFILESVAAMFWVSCYESKLIQLRRQLEITEAERDSAVQAAGTDPLTGLFNRRGAMEAARRLLEVNNRRGYSASDGGNPSPTPNQNQSVAVAYLDLDNFKGANDKLGHQVGDLIIQLAAELLRRSFARPTDIVCRRGGDEFVVILTEDAEAVVGQLEKFQRVFIAELRQLLNQNHQEDNPRIAVTVSCGVQVRPLLLSTDFATTTEGFLETMFKQADALMYQAKQLGKNRIALNIS